MIRYFSIIVFSVCISFCSCESEDVNELRRELDKQAERIAALEAWQKEVNGNIAALQGLVDALGKGKYITSVERTALGYTIVLSDQSVLRIYHGLNGKDGVDGSVVMPSFSVRDSSDGHVYWIVNGKLLLNEQGEGVRADGEKGDTGQTGGQGSAGISPQIRIDAETNEWEISLDSGTTWTSTGVKATGEKGETGETGPQGPAGPQGENIFAENGVDVQEDWVVFTLEDGTSMRLPRYRSWTMHFPEGTKVQVGMGAKKTIPFTVSGFGGEPSVNVFGNGGWQIEVLMDTGKQDSGVFLITAPLKESAASLLVLLNDGLGGGWTYRLEVRTL